MMSDKRVRMPVRRSSTLAIHEKVQRLQDAGRRVFHLGFGEARFPVHPKLLTALRDHAGASGYPPVAGLPELRQGVATYYRGFGLEADASRVIIGSGSKSLLFAALQALEGDLILPRPSWVSYEGQARLCGKQVTFAPTSIDDGYCLTPDGLKASLDRAREAGQSPAILVLNSPNNPTGMVYPDELLARLAAAARSERLAILSDEIYALCAHGEPRHRSVACHYPEATIVTGGLSKHLSLGGWRLGVAVLPPGELGTRLWRQMTAVASAVWTTASAPVQHAAVVAYGGDPEVERYIEACAAIQARLTHYLHRALDAAQIPCPRPCGGFYLYASFAPWRQALADRQGVRTSDELAELLLEKESIATLPGSEFGADPSDLSLRLSTSCLHSLADGTAAEVLSLHDRELPPDELVRRCCPQVVEVAAIFGQFVERLGLAQPMPRAEVGAR